MTPGSAERIARERVMSSLTPSPTSTLSLAVEDQARAAPAIGTVLTSFVTT